MTKAEEYLLFLIEERQKTPDMEKWRRGTFRQLKILPTTAIGNIAEDFAEYLAKNAKSGTVEKPKSRRGQYDLVVAGKRFEVKGATEDKSGGFQFNGVRYDTKYDFLLVIGISPDAVQFNIYPKKDLGGKDLPLVPMAKGANAGFKLTRRPAQLRRIGDFTKIIAACIRHGKPPRI